MLLTRRKALLGLFAAPAIIKLAPLMKIKPLASLRDVEEARFLEEMSDRFVFRRQFPAGVWRTINQGVAYGQNHHFFSELQIKAIA